MKAEYWDKSWKATPHLGRAQWFGNGCWQATHATVYGYVDMQAEQNVGGGYTWLDFIYQGRLHRRTVQAFYGPRYAARLATEFAREVVEGRALL